MTDPTSTPPPRAHRAPDVISPTPSPLACPETLDSVSRLVADGGTLNLTGCSYAGELTIDNPVAIIGLKLAGRILVNASDVTLYAVEVAPGDARAQNGQVHVRNADRFTMLHSYIHNGGGAGVSIDGGSGHIITASELAYMGQQGLHLPNVRHTLVKDNRIHNNNTDGYDPGWEVGAGKAVRAFRLVFENNEVFDNAGFGLWCDIYCHETIYRGNRIYNNLHAGIHDEVSYDGLVEGNIVYGNDPRRNGWWWPTQILVSSSSGTTVIDNVVAQGWAGITVVSQTRDDWPDIQPYRDIRLERNTIVDTERLIGWVDPDGIGLFETGRANISSDNRVWHSDAEPSLCRFEWNGCRDTLASFEQASGGHGNVYLTEAEARDLLVGSESPWETRTAPGDP
ncbi:hypothetical protein BH23CHL7_BH23CHL7_06440 [soil metagenome]